jgi:hypothetical protein
MPSPGTIGDLVAVRPHPTVVRLDDLDTPAAGWITESYCVTGDVARHLTALGNALRRPAGLGAFLIGQYGCGKSHFLAYLARQLEAGALVPDGPEVRVVSLLNYSSDARLEKVVADRLGIPVSDADRRGPWAELDGRHPRGLVLLVDELSEFLRSKPDRRSFNEDVRFLQFIGEWAAGHRLWIVAALQEQIEHIGELEHGLYRKIRDRYPLRLLLSPAHVLDLIGDSILIKRPGYDAAVAALVDRLGAADPDHAGDLSLLGRIYPLHPMTLELLEQVRDLFSQARGVVDFTVVRLGGSEERGAAPFLSRPWGELLTPEHIVDHFRDLFALQPEFLPLSEQLLPYYDRHLDALFDKEALRELAGRLIKLLVLVHLSPGHDAVAPAQARRWLAFAPSQIAPERNTAIVKRVLETLADRGRYVVARGDAGYALDLADDSAAQLERLLRQELADAPPDSDVLFEQIAPRLARGDGFNPLALPRDAWQPRVTTWYFHRREYSLYVGDEEPPPPGGLGLCVRLPWGARRPVPGCHTVVPERLQPDDGLREAAALARLLDRRPPRPVAERARSLLDQRVAALHARIGAAYLEPEIVDPTGAKERPLPARRSTTVDEWLAALAHRMLKRTYPSFERFAPSSGPLPKEAHRAFVRAARHSGLEAAEADELVTAVREGYLVPMGLLKRQGRRYDVAPRLERHELVRLVTSMLEHAPRPAVLYEHLAGPIFGLVPDQIHVLLVFLQLQGVLDLIKEDRSYSELFETLPLPLAFDRVVPGGEALDLEERRSLERLCQLLSIRAPEQWTVLAEQRVIGLLREAVRRCADQVSGLILRLEQHSPREGEQAAARLRDVLDRWSSLEREGREVERFRQLLYEVGSTARFNADWTLVHDLLGRAERQLAELHRHRHLLEGARRIRLAGADGTEIAAGLAAVGPPPGLEDPDALESWLRAAAGLYEAYGRAYRERHDRYWERIAAHRLWRVELPPLAASRHVAPAGELDALSREIKEARGRRCRALVNLEFQPVCSCGFDGEEAPAARELEALAVRAERLVEQTVRFFDQAKVRRRVAEWVEQGLPGSPATRDYLERRAPLPGIDDVELLDRHLAGLDLVRPVPVARVVELCASRTWEPAELLAALGRLLEELGGSRLAFDRGAGPEDDELLVWSVEQALARGVPLPPKLAPARLEALGERTQPDWVSPGALARLEQLGLGPALEDRVLGWLLDGTLAPPPADGASPLVRAASEVVRPTAPADPAELAELAHALYSAHPRLERLAGAPWLERLDRLARSVFGRSAPARGGASPLPSARSDIGRSAPARGGASPLPSARSDIGRSAPARGGASPLPSAGRSAPASGGVSPPGPRRDPRPPGRHAAEATADHRPLPDLVDLLREHPGAGWLVIDSLGLPLLEPLRARLGELLPGFRLESVRFARAASPTTTDGFYRALAAAGVQHPLEKIDCVDRILHARFEPLALLVPLMAAELSIACAAIRSRLDAAASLLVFGDHGFRLAPDGRSYTHGGTSTLEQVVPVLRLVRD